METTEYDQLMERYLHNDVTDTEKRKVKAWLDIMKAERESDLLWTEEDKQALFNKITSTSVGVEEVIAFRPKSSGKVPSFLESKPLRIAAGILLLLALSYGVWISSAGNTNEVIAKTEIQKVILTDGTIVWLHQSAKLSYSDNNNREVSLSGEALFEVAKDPSHPFVISCGDMKATVLGTSFNLKTSEQSLELQVLTGKVNLSSQANTQGVEVTENEKVIFYSNGGEVTKLNNDAHQLDNITRFTEYDMHFDNASMDKVIGRISSKFNVKINVENAHLYQCHVNNLNLTDRSLEKTLIRLKEILDMDYKINGTTVSISGSGCK